MQFKKLWNRLRGFFKEAVPLMMLGILLVQILFLTGVLDILFKIAAPVVTGLWGLPKETVSAMLVGIIRKDAAVALLVPLKLTGPQTITAIVTLVLYFPCVATYTVLARELGLKDLLKVTGIMLASTLIMGILLNLAGAAMPPIAIIGIELLVMAAAVIILNKVSSRREDEII
jgi:ferrous iron transport protein B